MITFFFPLLIWKRAYFNRSRTVLTTPLLLAGVLTLATALENTGIAHTLSKTLISSVGSWGPMALLATFYFLTSLFTEIMSNKAAVAVLAPIAITSAHSMGIDARPLLMNGYKADLTKALVRRALTMLRQ